MILCTNEESKAPEKVEGKGQVESEAFDTDSKVHQSDALRDALMLSGDVYNVLLAICAENALWDCGALNAMQFNRSKEKSSNIGMLVRLTAQVYLKNSSEGYMACLNGITAYVSNIIKDLSNRKPSTIKLTNGFLNRTIVAAKGGLELFAFGPAGFKPAVHASEGPCLECSVLYLVRPTASNERRSVYVAWVEKYLRFLRAASEMAKL
jgi:hypothetical protein